MWGHVRVVVINWSSFVPSVGSTPGSTALPGRRAWARVTIHINPHHTYMGADSHRIDLMAPLALKQEGDFVFVDVDPRHLLKAFVGPKPTSRHPQRTKELSDRPIPQRWVFLGFMAIWKIEFSLFGYKGIHFLNRRNPIVLCTILLSSRQHINSMRMGIQTSLASNFCGFGVGIVWWPVLVTKSAHNSNSPPKIIQTKPPRCPSLQLRLCSSSRIKPTWL